MNEFYEQKLTSN